MSDLRVGQFIKYNAYWGILLEIDGETAKIFIPTGDIAQVIRDEKISFLELTELINKYEIVVTENARSISQVYYHDCCGNLNKIQYFSHWVLSVELSRVRGSNRFMILPGETITPFGKLINKIYVEEKERSRGDISSIG